MKIGNALTITIEGSWTKAVKNLFLRRNCQKGKHVFVFEGARLCPFGLSDTCSQSVFRCEVCGAYDYGKKGGPGWDECNKDCKYDFRNSWK
jgi:hypothetical protein